MKFANKSKLIVLILLSLGALNIGQLLSGSAILAQGAISNPISSPISSPISTPNPISNPISFMTVSNQVSATFDDVNETNGKLDSLYGSSYPEVWIGNSGPSTDSWTGLRFINVNVPRGKTIKSAKLEVYSKKNQQILMMVKIGAQATGNSNTFSSINVPSKLNLTNSKVMSITNSKWNNATWYEVADLKSVIQEVTSRSDWQPGNSLSIVLHGEGIAWGRKFVSSFDGSSTLAPKLTVTYQN